MAINRNKIPYLKQGLTLLLIFFVLCLHQKISPAFTNSGVPVDSFEIKIKIQNRILDAIGTGDIHKVSKLTFGVDLNTRIHGGSTYLLEAIYAGSKEITSLLLTKGADPNLRAAPFYDVNDDPIPEESPLEASLETGDSFEITKLLIDHGADLNSGDSQGNTLLHLVLRSDVSETMDNRNNVRLTEVINSECDHTLPADKNKIIYEKIKWLIKKGADVNAVNLYGESPLLTAAWDENYNAAELLLSSGADATAKDSDGKTALFYSNSKKFVRKLIKMGADVNAQDKDGLTALHMAVFEGDLEIVKVLIENGADLNIRDSDSRLTPLEWMIVDWYSNYELAKYLVSKGAVYSNELVQQYGLTEDFKRIKKELGK